MYSKFYKVVIPILLIVAFVRFGVAQISGSSYTTYGLSDFIYLFGQTELTFGNTISVYQNLRDFYYEASDKLGDIRDECFTHQNVKDMISNSNVDSDGILFYILSILDSIFYFFYFVVYGVCAVFLTLCYLFCIILAIVMDFIGIIINIEKLLLSLFGMLDPGFLCFT